MDGFAKGSVGAQVPDQNEARGSLVVAEYRSPEMRPMPAWTHNPSPQRLLIYHNTARPGHFFIQPDVSLKE
jgi:hypothetical protein